MIIFFREIFGNLLLALNQSSNEVAATRGNICLVITSSGKQSSILVSSFLIPQDFKKYTHIWILLPFKL